MPYLAKEESRLLKNPNTAGGILYQMLRESKVVKRAVWERAIAKSDRVSTSRIAEHNKDAHETAVMNRIYVAIHFFAEIGLDLIYDADAKTFRLGRHKPEVKKTSKKSATKTATKKKVTVKKVKKVARKKTAAAKTEPVVVGDADSDDTEV